MLVLYRTVLYMQIIVERSSNKLIVNATLIELQVNYDTVKPREIHYQISGNQPASPG